MRSRAIYLPPAALRELEDPTPLEPADLVAAIRGHIVDSCCLPRDTLHESVGHDHSLCEWWAASVTVDEIANAVARRGYDGAYLDRILGVST